MEKIQISPISTTEGNDNFGKLFMQKEGSDFVSVRVTSTGFIPNGGIMNQVNKSALIRMKAEVLKPFLAYAGVGSINADNNSLPKAMPTTLTGLLQVQESFDPFYEGQSAKINPSTNELVMLDGRAVYRNTQFVADGPGYLFGAVEDGKFIAGLVNDEEVEGAETHSPAASTTAAEVPA